MNIRASNQRLYCFIIKSQFVYSVVWLFTIDIVSMNTLWYVSIIILANYFHSNQSPARDIIVYKCYCIDKEHNYKSALFDIIHVY